MPMTGAPSAADQAAARAAVEAPSIIIATLDSGRTQEIASTELGHLEVAIRDPQSAFGEIVAVDHLPLVQIDAVYGLVSTDTETFVSGTGAAATVSSNMFVADCGTDVGGYATIRSTRIARYRAGQGLMCRFTAMWPDGGGTDYLAGAGMFTATDGLWFGYLGSSFGLTRRVPGTYEIRRLTISAGASSSSNLTVTLNTVGVAVAVTAGDTAAVVAHKIAAATFTGWYASQNGSTVTFVANAPGVRSGTYSFSAGTTGVSASLAQVREGTANDHTTYFIAQQSWNRDTCDGDADAANPSGFNLNTTKLNVFQIVFPYLGGGPARFYVMNPVSGHWILVHQIEYPNAATTPNAGNPSLRMGWFSASTNTGATTSRKVYGASGAIFLEGTRMSLREPIAVAHTQTSVAASEVQLLAIRVSREFAGRYNQREVIPVTISVAPEGTKPMSFRVYLNGTRTGTQNWSYVSQSTSGVELETTNGITVSGGRPVGAGAVSGGSTVVIDLESRDIRLTAGDVLTLTGYITAGAGANVSVSITMREA